MKKTAAFKIDVETLQKLAKLSEDLDMTKSKIVNDLLVVLLRETDEIKLKNVLKETIKNLQS